MRFTCIYLGNSEKLLGELTRASTLGDHEAMYRAAHTLKSSSAQLGAVRLAELCRHLEQGLRRGQHTDIGPILPQVREQYTATRLALEKWLA